MERTSLCHICLRVGIDARALEEELFGFLDDVCDLAIFEVQPTYCSKCEHDLRQFYKFKKKCVEAIKILNQWRTTKATNRKPLSTLHTLLSQAHGTCKQDSIKFFRLKDIKTKTITAKRQKLQYLKIETKNREIDFVSVKQNDNNECDSKTNEKTEKVNPFIEEMEIKSESDGESDSKTTKIVKYDEPSRTADFPEEVPLKNEKPIVIKDDNCINDIVNDADDDSSNINEGELSDTGLNNQNDITDSDNDIIDVSIMKRKRSQKTFEKNNCDNSENDSDDEFTIPVKAKKNKNKPLRELTKIDINSDNKSNVENKKGVKRPGRRKKEPFSKERLKEKVLSIFENYKEVKSTDGAVIERDVILNNIDNLDFYTMKNLFNLTRSTETEFTSKALDLLAKLQKRFENKYDSVFDIEYLNTKEQVLDEFSKRTTYEVYVLSPFKCELCYRGFRFAKLLEYHQKTYHDLSAGEFMCQVCQVRMKTKRKLVDHTKQKHKVVFRCKLCPMTTYLKGNMVNHYNQHQGVRYECNKCSAVFKNSSSLKTHEMQSHVTEHVCALCARTFVSVSGLNMHRIRKHKVSPQDKVLADGVLCDICDIKFISNYVYEEHRRISHDGKKRYERRKQNVRDARVTCPVVNCEERVLGTYWLQQHLRAEHPERLTEPPGHLCDVCGKGFRSKSYLKYHRNLHAGHRPFACDKCPAKFHSPTALWKHAPRHGPPRWHCNDCGKRFYGSTDLSNHKRIHVGDRRYRCSLCPAAFLHSNSLTAHVSGVHHRQPRAKKRTQRAALSPVLDT